MNWKAIPTTTLSPKARALHSIRAQIVSRHLRRGDLLPSERHLSETLGVARNTLRSALDDLEADGWIETQGRSRRVIRSEARDKPGDILSSSFIIVSQLHSTPDELRRQPWREDSYVLTSAAKIIEKAGFSLFFIEPGKLTPEYQERIIAGRPGGILASVRSRDYSDPVVSFITAAHTAGLRPILYGKNEALPFCTCVYPDHEGATYELANWLVKRGRKRIVCAWLRPEMPSYLQDRYRGYRRALEKHRLTVLPPVICDSYSEAIFNGDSPFKKQVEVCHTALKCCFDGATMIPDAILAPSDHFVPPIFEACRRFGCHPHRDVAIAGYDNHWSPESPHQEMSPMITVEKNNPEIAVQIAKMALDADPPSAKQSVPRSVSCKLIPLSEK